MLTAIALAVESHVGARESFDDLTIVVFKRREVPAHAHPTAGTPSAP
jgi:hypothetical protein